MTRAIRPIHRRPALAFALALTLIAGCGGGGGGASIDGGGTGGTGTGGQQNTGPVAVSVGTMTIGSIILNSIRYADGSAQVTRDGRVASVGELRNGMVVKLRGNLNDDGLTGTASDVKVENEVRGLVQTVSAGTTPASFTVLGQTVIVDDLTVYANVSGVAVLAPGNSVEVHGQREVDGRIRASRVEVFNGAASPDDVRGPVANLNAGAMTFTVGGLLVDFATAAFSPSGTNAAALRNGTIVEARGATAGAGRFVATAITFEDAADAATFAPQASYKLSVEGYVTGFSAHPGSFSVNNQPVTTSASTRFELGTAPDLANNARVQAEGQVASGVIQASKISFRRTRTIVTGTSSAPSGCTLTILGKTVQVIDSTEIRNGGTTTGCANIATVGSRRVEARGYIDSTGAIVAERVDTNTSGGGGDILQALVTQEDEGARTLTLLGIVVTLATTPGSQLKNIDDVPFATPAAFFGAVTPNSTFVKVRGSLSGGVFSATEAEIEN